MVEITDYIDVAQITLYVFWIFFAGLIIYLQRESRREGFPLENDAGVADKGGWLMTPAPKTFHLPHGHGTVSVPDGKPDPNAHDLKAVRTAEFEGAPFAPTGDNPMLDGVGPGAWTRRADTPDLMHTGAAKIVPMRVAKDFSIAAGDLDPRGLRMVGCNSVVAGRIKDVWVDQAEQIIRYLEVETEVGETPRSVLVPMNFCKVLTPRDKEKVFYVHAITGEQFALVPGTKKKTEVTFLEEDKIMAYFGSGLLYATPQRQESFI